jgi:glycosyl transferase family 87
MTAGRARVGGALGDRRMLWAVVAVVVFLGSWVMLDHSFFAHGQIVDTPFYQAYGLAMRNGQVPYRDFAVEYPPGALPAFLVPTYFGEPTWIVDYQRWFARLMAVCGIGVLLFVLLARPPRHGVVLVAVSPLLAGALILSRFDLWPAALLAASVAAFVRDRHRLAWLALGLAFAVKVYAIVLIPLAIVWTLRRRGRGELVRGGVIWLVAVVAVFAPFAVVAAHGLWESLWGQVSRPIQVESLVASFLTTFGSPNDYVSHRSVAIAGHHGLAVVTTVVELACLVGLWIAFARGAAEPARFVRYAAACVCAFVVLGKVLSPQYLIWLVPLVALVYGRRGVAAALLLAAAMIETQYWFYAPRYRGYVDHHFHAPLVLLRNLILVALLVVLAAPARRKVHAPAPPTSRGRLESAS